MTPWRNVPVVRMVFFGLEYFADLGFDTRDPAVTAHEGFNATLLEGQILAVLNHPSSSADDKATCPPEPGTP